MGAGPKFCTNKALSPGRRATRACRPAAGRPRPVAPHPGDRTLGLLRFGPWTNFGALPAPVAWWLGDRPFFFTKITKQVGTFENS